MVSNKLETGSHDIKSAFYACSKSKTIKVLLIILLLFFAAAVVEVVGAEADPGLPTIKPYSPHCLLL